MKAPYTERYVRCCERTAVSHRLLLDCVTGNKKLEFQDCYFVGNIDRRGKTEKQDGGPTISRDWPGNTGIMAGNVIL